MDAGAGGDAGAAAPAARPAAAVRVTASGRRPPRACGATRTDHQIWCVRPEAPRYNTRFAAPVPTPARTTDPCERHRRSRHRRVASSHPGPRLRLAVHPAHRAAAPRAARLLRDHPVRHPGRRDRPAPTGRRDPLGRADERQRGRRAALRLRALRDGRAGARHLLRHAAHDAGPGRHPDAVVASRVRPCRCDGGRDRTAVRRPGADAEGVGQPRRFGRRGAAGLRGRGQQRDRAGRRHRAPRSRPLRPAVPPRSGAHAARRRPAADLRHRRLRLPRRLDDGVVHRRSRGPHPGRGRRRARRVRPVGRRRFDRRGAAGAQGDRRSADLHLRRQRPAARAGGGPGRGPLPQPHEAAAGRRRRRVALPGAAGRRHRSGDEAQDHRRRVHRRVRGRRQGHRRVRLPGAGHALSRT